MTMTVTNKHSFKMDCRTMSRGCQVIVQLHNNKGCDVKFNLLIVIYLLLYVSSTRQLARVVSFERVNSSGCNFTSQIAVLSTDWPLIFRYRIGDKGSIIWNAISEHLIDITCSFRSFLNKVRGKNISRNISFEALSSQTLPLKEDLNISPSLYIDIFQRLRN